MKALIAAVILTIGSAGIVLSSDEAPKPLVIGGGTPFGYYFGLSGALCRAVNERTPETPRCLNLAAGASARNLKGLDEGSLDFAVVQSDWLRHAVEGTSRYRASGPNDAFRSVLSFPAESLTILARRQLGAKVLLHLAGRRVGYDTANPYAYILMQNAVAAARIDIESVSRDAKAGSAVARICAGEIDVFVTVERHLSGRVADMISRCGLELVALDTATVDTAIAEHPELIAHRIYQGAAEERRSLSTLGLAAVLVTTSETPDAVVTRLLEALFEKSEKANAVSAVFSAVTAKDVAAAARIAPLHDTAAAFFKARGWRD